MPAIHQPLALIEEDAGNGGFNVRDTRDGQVIAWRGYVREAAAIVARLNACYPPGVPAPAYDTLVHEVRMTRIGARASLRPTGRSGESSALTRTCRPVSAARSP